MKKVSQTNLGLQCWVILQKKSCKVKREKKVNQNMANDCRNKAPTPHDSNSFLERKKMSKKAKFQKVLYLSNYSSRIANEDNDIEKKGGGEKENSRNNFLFSVSFCAYFSQSLLNKKSRETV